MDQYPTIGFIVEHGRWIARSIAALPILLVLGGMVLLGWPAILLAGAVPVSAVVFFLMKSYVEIVQAVADALIPK